MWKSGLRLLLAVAVTSGAGLGLSADWSRPADAADYAEQGQRADKFVDSIGVAVHLRYTNTTYGHYDDIIKPRLQELKVRYIRDGGKDQNLFDKLNDLATIGIKSTLVMDPRDNILPSNVVNDVLKKVPNSVIAAEGPNEWDVNGSLTYNGKSFPQGVKDYQTQLYAAIKADPATQYVSVLAPSMAVPENADLLGSLANSVDGGNMHSYAGGNLPDQDLDSRWIPKARTISGPTKPVVATESGWHTATNEEAWAQKGVSEAAQGKYIQRLYLEYFMRGVQRAHIYELADEAPDASNGQSENHYGIIRADGSRKPAFNALRNMIGLLEDPGDQTYPLRTLSYSLASNKDTVKHLLLQKRDGTFYLALWNNASAYDYNAEQDVVNADASAILTFGQPVRQVEVYRPGVSAGAQSTSLHPTQMKVQVPDEPVILKITPDENPLPGKLEAEAYTDSFDVGIKGSSDVGGGSIVAYIDNGDWMSYPVNVLAKGSYSVQFRVASPNAGGNVQLRDAGGHTLGTVAVPNTGGWDNWQTVSMNVSLGAGPQTLKVYAGTGGFDFNWMSFATAIADIPGQVEAESYIDSAGVGTKASSDTGGGDIAAFIDTGDWMDYNVNALAAGTYNVQLRVASPNSGGSVQLRAADGRSLGSVAIPNTGSWDHWQTVGTQVKLDGGVQTIRVYVAAGGFDFNWMRWTSPDVREVGSTIEAESFNECAGIGVKGSTDTGGGDIVAFLDNGDWMDYMNVRIPATGTYQLGFRVTSGFAGAQLQVKRADGATLATVNVPNTGGWSNWTTVSVPATLQAGMQTLRIYVSGAGFDFNWWTIT